MQPNRIAVYLASAAALLGGLAPVVADLDWTSTAGVVAGVLALVAVVRKWLDGWQAYEARTAAPAVFTNVPATASSATVYTTGTTGQVNTGEIVEPLDPELGDEPIRVEIPPDEVDSGPEAKS